MQNGNLSSAPVARIILVWEGALAFLDPKDEVRFLKLMRQRRFHDAAGLWYPNDVMAAAVWRVTWHQSMACDVVTFLGPEGFGAAIRAWVDEAELPVNNVWATTPQVLGRKLTYRPNWVRVYDPFPDHQLMYGSRGKLITHEGQLGY